MKGTMLIVIVAFLIISCTNANTEKNTAPPPPPIPDSVFINTTDSIVSSSVANNKGETLFMKYNNKQGTAVFILGKDTLHLKQDTTASGVHYSNKDWEYEEWHGEITLKKGSKIIFTNK